MSFGRMLTYDLILYSEVRMCIEDCKESREIYYKLKLTFSEISFDTFKFKICAKILNFFLCDPDDNIHYFILHEK